MQLAELPNPSLTEKLIRRQSDPAGHSQVSSHWREMHHRTVARVADGAAISEAGKLELSGHGFGNIQNCHPIQLPLEWLTSFSYWLLSEKKSELAEGIGVLRKLFKRIGPEFRLKMTFDAVRQVLVWNTVRPYLPRRGALRWVLVGDGYGVLSALIKEFQPDAKLFLIDLPKTLVFQSVYVQKMHPLCTHSLLEDGVESDFTYVPSPALPEEAGPFDVFVNVASMQEMTMPVIQGYFDFFRRMGRDDHLFYCCNRVEKKLPGGEVIRFDDYPWDGGDLFLIDEICPFQRFFFHLRTLANGPRIAGVRFPFINAFDGPTRHRLARLKLNREARS